MRYLATFNGSPLPDLIITRRSEAMAAYSKEADLLLNLRQVGEKLRIELETPERARIVAVCGDAVRQLGVLEIHKKVGREYTKRREGALRKFRGTYRALDGSFDSPLIMVEARSRLAAAKMIAEQAGVCSPRKGYGPLIIFAYAQNEFQREFLHMREGKVLGRIVLEQQCPITKRWVLCMHRYEQAVNRRGEPIQQ